MTDKPIFAVIFSLIGGICTVASAVVLAIYGKILNYLILGQDYGYGYIFEIVFGIVGAVMIAGSIMMYRQQSTRRWGTITMLMGIIAFLGTAITVVGGVLAVMGGVLGMQLSFIAQSARTLKLAVKPGREELWLSIRISLLGIVVIGLVGFVIKFIAVALNFG